MVVWVLILVIFIGLFFVFPRKTAIAGGAALILFAGIFAFVFYEDSQSRATRAQMVEAVKLVAQYDQDMCTAEQPIKIAISNENPETLVAIELTLKGFRPGHSEPLFDSISDTVSTDRILKQGEGYEFCAPLPRLSSKALQEGAKPEEQDLGALEWVATHQSTGMRFE